MHYLGYTFLSSLTIPFEMLLLLYFLEGILNVIVRKLNLVIFLCTSFCNHVSYTVIRVFFFFFGLVHNYPERCLSEILSWLLDDKGGGRLVSCI